MLHSEVASNAAIKLTTRAFAALKANSVIRSCLSGVRRALRCQSVHAICA